jgi:hypothetical protein
MAPDIARLAMQFLMRPQTTLAGNEVPAFNAVMQALEREQEGAGQEADDQPAPMRVVGGAA